MVVRPSYTCFEHSTNSTPSGVVIKCRNYEVLENGISRCESVAVISALVKLRIVVSPFSFGAVCPWIQVVVGYSGIVHGPGLE
jgi:hypothetical protein